MKIIFAGTPDIAVPVLAGLYKTKHQIIQVLTQPDRPAGRGHKLLPSPVKKFAEQHSLPVFQPENFKDPATIAALSAADLMVVIAYGIILPQAVLDLPRLGCINLHVSLLPRWRGSAPMQRAIIAGDTLTGISMMQMDAGMDTGPVLAYETLPINSADTTASLQEKLSVLSAQILLANLDNIEQGKLTPQPQDNNAVTYAAKILKEEACLNWELGAIQLDRLVRAFNPWPIAYTYFNAERIRIWQTKPINEFSGAPPGMIVGMSKEGIDVACGGGILRIIKLQWPGGNVLDAYRVLNGNSQLIIGAYFTHEPQ